VLGHKEARQNRKSSAGAAGRVFDQRDFFIEVAVEFVDEGVRFGGRCWLALPGFGGADAVAKEGFQRSGNPGQENRAGCGDSWPAMLANSLYAGDDGCCDRSAMELL
jgi:hypothetical protein